MWYSYEYDAVGRPRTEEGIFLEWNRQAILLRKSLKQVIGVMGGSGNGSLTMYATHLHFEVRVNGVIQDPLNYIKYQMTNNYY